MKEKTLNHASLDAVHTRGSIKEIRGKRENKDQSDIKGITLVALVITIVVLLILAGITIMYVMGDNGVWGRATEAKEQMDIAQAKEKLEGVLLDLQALKYTDEINYNEKEYINQKLLNCGITPIGEEVAVIDSYQFLIDRSVPKIKASMGNTKLNEEIKIAVESKVDNSYFVGSMKIVLTYPKEISEVTINGEDITEKLTKTGEGSYTIENIEIKENGFYTIIVRDENQNYQIANEKITSLTEDMTIYDRATLEEFRRKVNTEGRTFENRIVRVTQDIDLEGEKNPWTAIASEKTPFKGTFEGNQHTINNLYLVGSGESSGLFYANEGTIKDIMIEGNISSEYDNLGMLVGTNKGKIENVTVRGEIWGKNNVGGVAGKNIENAQIMNCTNYAVINKERTEFVWGQQGKDIGGIVGSSDGKSIQGCMNYGRIRGDHFVGGIVGYGNELMECGNEAKITAMHCMAGGIAGVTQNRNPHKITACYNNASIEVLGTYVGSTNSDGGGICGGGADVYYCYNRGDVTVPSSNSYNQVGGICGDNYNLGYTVSNCYNTGKITGTRNGTITGNNYGCYIKNCWWDIVGNANGFGGSVTNSSKVSTTTLKGYSSTLGATYFTEDKNNINDGYPILKWQVKEEKD